MPASFKDQLAIVGDLLHEIARMEAGEKRFAQAASLSAYERELRLAGLAQRVAQAYTIIEGVLAFVARRIDRVPVSGDDWHKKLIARCARPSAVRENLDRLFNAARAFGAQCETFAASLPKARNRERS